MRTGRPKTSVFWLMESGERVALPGAPQRFTDQVRNIRKRTGRMFSFTFNRSTNVTEVHRVR